MTGKEQGCPPLAEAVKQGATATQGSGGGMGGSMSDGMSGGGN